MGILKLTSKKLKQNLKTRLNGFFKTLLSLCIYAKNSVQSFIFCKKNNLEGVLTKLTQLGLS